MAIFGISCSCFLVLLLLFVLNVKTEIASATVESSIQVTDGKTPSAEPRTRETRQVKQGQMPYLLIRPSYANGKTTFFIENPPASKMKYANPKSFVSMQGNPEFYIREGEIFSLDRMYPFFGIDPNRGFLTNVKKGSMQHFLSGRPTSTKLHYIKPVVSSTNGPSYQLPRQTSPRPFREDVPFTNFITPATYRDAFPNKPHSPKQELVYQEALREEFNDDKHHETQVHNAEYSPVFVRKDVIVGKPVDIIIPPPTIQKTPGFGYRPNSIQQTFYHPFHSKTIDLTETRPNIPFYDNQGPYSPTKSPLSIFRKAPQIEYFMPQNQQFADIEIHTDMDKSVQVQSHDHPAEESMHSVKYHSTVKLNKDRPVEPYFDINKHLTPNEVHAKNSVDMTTEIPFVLYDDNDNIEPQKYVSRGPVEGKHNSDIKPVSEALDEDVYTTFAAKTVAEPTKIPTFFNKSPKQRKQSSKVKLIPTVLPTIEPAVTTAEHHNHEEIHPITENPLACEKECIQQLTSKDFDPVCGSDNRTYSNKGKLRCAQTCKRTDLTIKSYGICGKSS